MLALSKVARTGRRVPVFCNGKYSARYGTDCSSDSPCPVSGGPPRGNKSGGDSDVPFGTPYDCRKFSHNLPNNCTFLPFEGFAGVPTGVFRITAGERLGPGADKCGLYKQAEYFAFHHSTFYDMHLWLHCCRQPRVDLKRKPVTF